jgi:hypothetical protein
MPGSADTDRLGRQAALGIAAGRAALGCGALAATGPALRALGFADADADAAAVALARLAGSRDLAIGLLTIAAREDRRALRAATALSAAVDAADAIAFGTLSLNPRTRRAGAIGALSGAGAALAGLLAWRRLG